MLDAWGADVVIVETVGVGQDELEITRTAHTTLVVMAPGLGDDVQAIKAGILECADVFAVNKADRDGADATMRDLELMIALGGETVTGGSHSRDHAPGALDVRGEGGARARRVGAAHSEMRGHEEHGIAELLGAAGGAPRLARANAGRARAARGAAPRRDAGARSATRSPPLRSTSLRDAIEEAAVPVAARDDRPLRRLRATHRTFPQRSLRYARQLKANLLSAPH